MRRRLTATLSRKKVVEKFNEDHVKDCTTAWNLSHQSAPRCKCLLGKKKKKKRIPEEAPRWDFLFFKKKENKQKKRISKKTVLTSGSSFI
jgi:hypothetical protein